MRARRSIEQAFYDIFADMSIDEQEIALKLMSYEHHQAIRRARRKTVSTASVVDQQALPIGAKLEEST